MVGGNAGQVALPASRAKRHERRPSGAILLAQRWSNDRDDLGVPGQDDAQRFVEASAGVHLARPEQLVVYLDRLEEFAEQAEHVFGETDAESQSVPAARSRVA